MRRKLFIEFEEPERDEAIEKIGHELIGYLVRNAKSDAPKKAVDICKALGLGTDSAVQTVVHHLRGHVGAQVASRCYRPAGYFMAANEAEIKETEANLKSRALSCLFALSGMRRGRGEESQLRLL